jgi:hypothetical protein
MIIDCSIHSNAWCGVPHLPGLTGFGLRLLFLYLSSVAFGQNFLGYFGKMFKETIQGAAPREAK